MREVILPNGKRTTQVGFGCSALNGGIDSRHSRLLVEAALDAGIRHFDVAPSYGNGMAEKILGGALASHRDIVTITTKAGLGKPVSPTLMSLLRGLAKPVLHNLPSHLKRRAASGVLGGLKREYDSVSVTKSLAGSILDLQQEQIDIFLMHEIRLSDVTADLVLTLQSFLRDGLVGSFGVGTSESECRAIAAKWAPLGTVCQFAWNIFDPPPEAALGGFTVIHRSIRNGFERAARWLEDRPATAAAWSDQLDCDLKDRECVADLLLAAAIEANPNGLVLVSSSRVERIRRHVEVASNSRTRAAGAKLSSLLQNTLASSHEET
jgi:D-threo-aldose 1-dehydrogenase